MFLFGVYTIPCAKDVRFLPFRRPADGKDNAFQFHQQDETGEREGDAVAKPDRRSIPPQAVENPKQGARLEHKERGQAEIIGAAAAPGPHDLWQEGEGCQAAGHKAYIFDAVHGGALPH